ncbi:hypothetical protein [Pseudobutyrivibrio ruminis]|uniref:hypothetical protein n=1 Tax=Pseudobutyrivibrio ruminis TaxID=46206 RepID=UPI0004120A73|nr:hypothetical protein [Pseudobutyrivibrio ruminis]
MKILKQIKRGISSCLVASCLASSLFPLTAHADAKANENTANTKETFLDENYIPFRPYYSSFLATYSSANSANVKKVWEKLFYEEMNWDAKHGDFYDSNYSSWAEKYYSDYIGLGGAVHSSKSMQITLSEGDFDAFFGNSLKRNPEFLGELLGLDNYQKPSEDNSEANQLMTNIMCQYLLSPEKYPYVAKAIVDLTKEGLYIGDKKSSDNNILKNQSYNNKSFDLYVLNAIAYYYEGDGDETYLSNKQLEWLESYKEYLFKDYISKSKTYNDKLSLAGTYPSLYDLIARSTYAADSTHPVHGAQEFFDYVVASKSGAGAWVNLIKGVHIEGLNEFDTLEDIFAFSDGYCFGHESALCVTKQDCLSTEQQGKATHVDEIAYLLNKQPKVVELIKKNPTVMDAYSNQTTMGGWLERFNIHHDKSGQALFYSLNVNAASGGSSYSRRNSETGTSHYEVLTSSYGTVTLPLINIDKNSNGIDPLSRTTAITIHPSTYQTGNGWHSSVGGGIYGYSVNINGVESKTRVPLIGHTFNISNLTWEERKAAVITVNLYSTGYGTYNGQECYNGVCYYHIGSCYAEASTNCSSTVTLSVKREDCAINGHDWRGNVEWADDYKTATIKYSCQNDVKHIKEITSDVSCREEDDYFVYTIKSPLTKSLDVKNNTYSTRVSKKTGEAKETIPITAANTNGKISDYSICTSTWMPYGSLSKETYKQAFTSIQFGINKGVIKPGAKSVTIDLAANRELTNLSITIYSASGEVLAFNNPCVDARTCYLNGLTDAELIGCYASVSASAHTQNWTYNYDWKRGIQPSDAISTLSAKNIIISYK